MAETVLITGAAHGIGRASAEKLLSEGYLVYGCDKDEIRLGTLTHPNFRQSHGRVFGRGRASGRR